MGVSEGGNEGRWERYAVGGDIAGALSEAMEWDGGVSSGASPNVSTRTSSCLLHELDRVRGR